ncbi:hypothetical protein BSKO_11063 [Bryopsis sp. KO-2023]|nr:hypothetical protein BSKO_11063 [Bryopsis sp. KO-2023]
MVASSVVEVCVWLGLFLWAMNWNLASNGGKKIGLPATSSPASTPRPCDPEPSHPESSNSTDRPALRRSALLKLKNLRSRTRGGSEMLVASKSRTNRGGLMWEMLSGKDQTSPQNLRKAGFKLSASRKCLSAAGSNPNKTPSTKANLPGQSRPSNPPSGNAAVAKNPPVPSGKKANADCGAKCPENQQSKKVGRLAVVLDLDGTMIRSWHECKDPRRSPFANVPPQVQRAILHDKLETFKYRGFIGVVRPGAERFIREIATFADVFIGTLASPGYAAYVRRVLDGDRGLVRGMTTSADRDENGLKNLDLFNHDPKRIVIVDDDTMIRQKSNIVEARPFYGDHEDKDLDFILTRLRALNGVYDVRRYEIFRRGRLSPRRPKDKSNPSA